MQRLDQMHEHQHRSRSNQRVPEPWNSSKDRQRISGNYQRLLTGQERRYGRRDLGRYVQEAQHYSL